MGRYCSGGKGGTHCKGGRNVGYSIRTPTRVDKSSDVGEGPIHKTVGKTGKFDKTRVLIVSPPSGYNLNNDDATDKKVEGGIGG